MYEVVMMGNKVDQNFDVFFYRNLWTYKGGNLEIFAKNKDILNYMNNNFYYYDNSPIIDDTLTYDIINDTQYEIINNSMNPYDLVEFSDSNNGFVFKFDNEELAFYFKLKFC